MSKVLAIIVVIISAIITLVFSSTKVGGNKVEEWKESKGKFHDDCIIIGAFAGLAILLIIAF